MATATKSKPTSNQKSQVPATTKRSVPAAASAAAEYAKQYAGEGVSHRAEDNIVPLVYLLQANSPQTQRGHEKYVKGAVGGSIWLRNAPDGESLFGGEDGMVFQPCHFSECWIEWMPNRGGFVARYQTRPEIAELKDVEREDGTMVKRWLMPSGNVVQESREIAGFVHLGDERLPYTIPFTGTNISVAKAWNTAMRRTKLPGTEAPAPIYSILGRIKTKLRTKGEWSWYVYEIENEGSGFVESVEDVKAGKALFDAFETGTKRSAEMEAEQEVTTEVDE